jgi:hypothetical protein
VILVSCLLYGYNVFYGFSVVPFCDFGIVLQCFLWFQFYALHKCVFGFGVMFLLWFQCCALFIVTVYLVALMSCFMNFYNVSFWFGGMSYVILQCILWFWYYVFL